MQILEEAIKYRWGALPEQQRQGIRNYISNLIIKISSNEATFRSEKVFLNKLNIILVQVRAFLFECMRLRAMAWSIALSGQKRFSLLCLWCVHTLPNQTHFTKNSGFPTSGNAPEYTIVAPYIMPARQRRSSWCYNFHFSCLLATAGGEAGLASEMAELCPRSCWSFKDERDAL